MLLGGQLHSNVLLLCGIMVAESPANTLKVTLGESDDYTMNSIANSVVVP